MPELPEVQTVVDGINKKVKGKKILDIWTDYESPYFCGKENIKDPKYFSFFKKSFAGKKILKAQRRAKNILIFTDSDFVVLIHLKMTGHLLYGKYFWNKKEKIWEPDGGFAEGKSAKEKSPLQNTFNRFIHLIFKLDDEKFLALSDMRKFAKICLIKKENLDKYLEKTGPEILPKDFSAKNLKERLFLQKNGKIKSVLMNPEIVAGIGNIYSDEILFSSKIHPESIISKIPEKKFSEILKNSKKILEKSLKVGGDSMSDFRNIEGKRGDFQNFHKAYKKEGEKCSLKNCSGIIEKKLIGGRVGRFCKKHQILYK